MISPARVTDIDGQERDYYPSATEELVEDALRKLAIEQQAGYFDKPNYRSGVVFTLYALREELKAARPYPLLSGNRSGAQRAYPAASSKYARKARRREKLSAAPLSTVTCAVSRAKLREDPKAKWAVQFHPSLPAASIKLTYRQFNYRLMMSHNTQLARWLHKQLVLKYTFASITAPFEMRYSTIKRDSGPLKGYMRSRDAIAALEEALTELKARQFCWTLTPGHDRQARQDRRSLHADALVRIRARHEGGQQDASPWPWKRSKPDPAGRFRSRFVAKAVGLSRVSGRNRSAKLFSSR